MDKTYCGKECESCKLREQLNCPGCKRGPGKYMFGDCKLAGCCCQKDYAGCRDCEEKENCSLLAEKEKISQIRLEDIRSGKAYIEEQSAEVEKLRSLITCVWLLLITSIIPLGNLFYGGIMFVWREKVEGFKTAAICYYIAPILGMLAFLGLFSMEYVGVNAENIYFLIPFAVVGIIAKYNEWRGLSDILHECESELAELFSKLWIGWLIANVIFMFGFVDDMSWESGFMGLGGLALKLMSLVTVGIFIYMLVKLNEKEKRKMQKE